MNILVRRSGALGDCLCVTPIIARLRKENPGAFIGIHTAYGIVFQGNPHVDGVNNDRDWDRTIDLDMAHETRRNLQAIDAYCEVAFGDHGESMDKSLVFAPAMLPNLNLDWKKVISIHPNMSWKNRTMPSAWWNHVTTTLGSHGYKILVLGTKIDYCPESPYTVDCREQLTLHQQAAVIGASRVFICGASGLFILAACTDTPVITPLTINRPDSALPWRHGIQGFGYFPLVANTPCVGCSERAGPVTFLGCEIGSYACIDSIPAEDAVEVALGVLANGLQDPHPDHRR